MGKVARTSVQWFGGPICDREGGRHIRMVVRGLVLLFVMGKVAVTSDGGRDIRSVVRDPICHGEGGRDIRTVVRGLFCIFAPLTLFSAR
ncbi:hypothetical protein CsSME_00036442 [Camellia sinensis var. sinensis]